MSRRPPAPWLAVGLGLLVSLFAGGALGGCGDDGSASPTRPGQPGGTPLSGEIIVYAAASLTDAFKEAGAAFSQANPGVKVTFNFASSSALATQINQGQPGDVFASADSAQMKVVTDKGGADVPVVFVTNVPVVVVPSSGSPVGTFNDLSKPGVKLVLAGPAVPIGSYARQVFRNASAPNGGIATDFSERVLANLKSNETDVKAVLAKVQTGEADAGVVYTTDVAAAARRVKTIPIPDGYNVVAQYPIATLKSASHADVARAFVAFILSAPGQEILAKFGFGPPDATGPR